MKRFLVALACFELFVGGQLVPTSKPAHATVVHALANCQGRWIGSGQQPGGTPWTIDMSVVSEAASCGTIEYPSLRCGGNLTQCASRSNGSAFFQEVYTHNPGTCAPAGQIVARCANGEMHWTWNGEGGPVSTTLRRRDR